MSRALELNRHLLKASSLAWGQATVPPGIVYVRLTNPSYLSYLGVVPYTFRMWVGGAPGLP